MLPSSHALFLPLFFIFFLISNLNPSLSQKPNQITSFSISNSPWTPDQNQILLSPNSTFAAGFLPQPTSLNLFTFSIWYHSTNTTTVWSSPPVNRSFSLSVTPSGELTLPGPPGQKLWPNPIPSTNNTTQLILRESGNLMFGRWESFSFPSDTILPNQNFTGRELTSANGKFKLIGDQLVFVSRNDSYLNIPNGPITGFDDMGGVSLQKGTFVASDFGDRNLRRIKLDDDGNLRIYSFDQELRDWSVVWQAIFNLCRIHGTCGLNTICVEDPSNSSTSCVCPPGYRRAPGGCEIETPVIGAKDTTFHRLDYVSFNGEEDLKAGNFSSCEAQCRNKGNCLGFKYKYDGSGYCVLLLDELISGFWSPDTETAMFLRLANGSETSGPDFTGMTDVMDTSCPVRISLPFPPEDSSATTRNIVIISTLFAAELISGVFFFWAFLKKYIKYRDMARTFGLEVMQAGGPKRFSHSELKHATKNFTDFIGRGGFGEVYRGTLGDGRVVAVKCLRNVTGGDADFWAEVTIVARMHHLNLVRLWGFCDEKGKKMLVYEYVPNGSLDKFLFQKNLPTVESPSSEEDAKPVLDWSVRYRIALGVARVIAYLHEECSEWVLHCDLKPENILLGEDFCPKVSDFGLAKLKKKEDMMSVSRMRGTPGYIAPEWNGPDPITPKADVYSFGLVLLEIVSGVRNFEQFTSKVDSDQWYFPRWAFEKVFVENNVEDVLDARIKHLYDSRAHFDAVNRMAMTAIWCLQDRPDMRPSMGKVAKMLEGTLEITEPKRPSIFFIADE